MKYAVVNTVTLQYATPHKYIYIYIYIIVLLLVKSKYNHNAPLCQTGHKKCQKHGDC
jgi:hypothetical protein